MGADHENAWNLRTALVICTDENGLSAALFAAHSAAVMSPDRSFDILICSLSALPIPEQLKELGIGNLVLPVLSKMQALDLSVRHLPITAYLRLWLPEMLGDRYDRILYVDYDTRIMSPDLGSVFGIDLGPHAFGAVLDKLQWHHPDSAVLDFADRGIASRHYLNSGVLLIDVPAWVQENPTIRVLTYRKDTHPIQCHDQSLINLAVEVEFSPAQPGLELANRQPFPQYDQPCCAQSPTFHGVQKTLASWRNAQRSWVRPCSRLSQLLRQTRSSRPIRPTPQRHASIIAPMAAAAIQTMDGAAPLVAIDG